MDETKASSVEKDVWGERPEDVLLCLHDDEIGPCFLPYGHGGDHDTRDISPGECSRCGRMTRPNGECWSCPTCPTPPGSSATN